MQRPRSAGLETTNKAVSSEQQRRPGAARCNRRPPKSSSKATASPHERQRSSKESPTKDVGGSIVVKASPASWSTEQVAQWTEKAKLLASSALDSCRGWPGLPSSAGPLSFGMPDASLLAQAAGGLPLPFLQWPQAKQAAQSNADTHQRAEVREKRPSTGQPLADKALKERAEEEAALRLLKQQAGKNEAIRLLQERAKQGSKPGQRRDKFKLGLVVEGGGMRGAVSGGGLQALHDLGMRDCFDAVYGSSAGAINSSYFLSGQRWGVDIYNQDITTAKFIDLRRLLKSSDDTQRPALDLQFLLDYIMDEVKPLDWQAVIDSAVPLKIVASCLDTLQPVLMERYKSKEDLRECMRASATVPVVAGDPVYHRGSHMVDAAVFEVIPFRAAIADGCTHIIALPTRPPFKKADFWGRWIDSNVSTLVKKAVLSPGYMKKAWAKEVEYQRAFGITAEELLSKGLEPGHHKLPAMAGCHVFPIYPGPAASYSPLCIDPATVMLGIAEGRSAVLNILGSAEQQEAAGAQVKSKSKSVKQNGRHKKERAVATAKKV